jgi:hypothetical protein
MSERPPFFKGQGFRLASISVGIAIGVGAMLVTRALISDEPLSTASLIGMGIGVAIAAVGIVAGLLLGRRIFGQRLELALRPAGETTWKHGRIDASPGHMRFRPYRWQVRLFSGEPVDFVVHEVGLDTGRRPSKKQLWSVNPSLHVIEAETDQGTLELGLQSHQVDDIRARIQPTGTSA